MLQLISGVPIVRETAPNLTPRSTMTWRGRMSVAVVLACAVVGVPWLALAATPLRVVTPREDREILDDVREILG